MKISRSLLCLGFLLAGIVREIPLADCIAAARDMLAGQVVGRYLVDVNR